ncbi:MAG: hypothetical protein A2W91_10730 [Bacteroidetes bacterium GWF2_38_335]|nr:MAG: hypothetical protein A2W91_10730 [Bacteroidetes bacterium GWF2_38_335]OFY81823.1 MAG: hypothetical protein A2281_06310 [Bacteroidetes bacterium RIFOXYA12_FULL_38_20]HBS87896.1 hypothetical protein [Bacteroidales bacterium]
MLGKWFPLLSLNFFGILNDSFLKKLFAFVSIYWIAGKENDGDLMNFYLGLSGFLFVLPYIVFSPFAGKLSRQYLKRKIVIWAKIAEFPVAVIGGMGFLMNSVYLVLLTIFLMGIISCLFSPAKYGLIRDIGGKEGISFGSGAFEMVAFLGNLSGAVLAGIVADVSGHQDYFIIGLVILIAFNGWYSAINIKAVESETEKNNESTLKSFVGSIKWSKNIPGLLNVILCLGLFWLSVSMVDMVIAVHGPNVLNISKTETGYIIAGVAVCVAAGSLAAGLLSGKKVRLSLVPIGAIGFSIPFTMIYFLNPAVELFTLLLLIAAFFAGIYMVPLNAFIQDRVEGRKLGDILAFNNFSIFSFVLTSAVIFMVIENSVMVFLAIAAVSWIMIALSIILHPGIIKLFIKLFRKRKA